MNNTIKVGIVSDTHGHIDERIVDIVNQCDHIIHAGDIMGMHILEALKPKKKLYAVRGNNDYADCYAHLPEKHIIELPGGLVVVEHGHRHGNFPDHDELRRHHSEARLVVYGHTHKRIIDKAGEPWIVNPGAAGRERTKGGPSCLLVNASDTHWDIEEIVFADSDRTGTSAAA